MKMSKSLLLYKSSVIGWILIIVEPVDVYIQTILLERSMLWAKSIRSNFLIVSVNSSNRYTTGTSIGPSKGLNENLQQRGNNQFAKAVTTLTAARANPFVALAKPLYPMSCKPVD